MGAVKRKRADVNTTMAKKVSYGMRKVNKC